jgi:ribA/ribD-fused uncharacterized protein
MSNFREKYLKYKKKYIELKNQFGGAKIDIVYFNEANGQYSAFSNFHQKPFMYKPEGQAKPLLFSNSEQAFCYEKASFFGYDPTVLEVILGTTNPAEVKDISSGDAKVWDCANKVYVNIGATMTPEQWGQWGAINGDIFYRILLAKFSIENYDDPDPVELEMVKVLNDTAHAVLVEAYWADPNWGIGYDANGVIPNERGEDLPRNEMFTADNNIFWLDNYTPKWFRPGYRRVEGNPIGYVMDPNGELMRYRLDKEGKPVPYKFGEDKKPILYEVDAEGERKYYEMAFSANRLGDALIKVRNENRKLYPKIAVTPPPLPPLEKANASASAAAGLLKYNKYN